MPNQCLSKAGHWWQWGSGDRVSVVPQSPSHLGYPALCILGRGCHGDAHLSLQQEHRGLMSSVHCSGFHSSPALSPSSLQAGKQKEITRSRSWSCAVCHRLPAPTSLGGTAFILSSTRDPQEGQVWKMEHCTSASKCRGEGIRNQALCLVPLVLPCTPSMAPGWRWRINSDANPPTAAQIKQQQVRELAPGGILTVCGAATGAPASHRAGRCYRAREAMAGGDSLLSATGVVLVVWLQRMVP